MIRKHLLCGECYRKYKDIDLPPDPPADVVYEPCCECGQADGYLVGLYPKLFLPACRNLTHPRTDENQKT